MASAKFVQQGNTLAGTGDVGSYYEGTSVSLSTDGSTAIVSGVNDCGGLGAAWGYARFGAVWSQQGEKLVGTGPHSRRHGVDLFVEA